MILTVKEIRAALHGIGSNRLVTITPEGITLVNRVPLSRRTINAGHVYTLLDSGFTAREVARKLKTSEQVVNYLRNERNKVLKIAEKNEREST